ncbi:MAG: energy-coupling factor ABC transporter ATP-binding protein [Defluviitaleaceae bacterium]|nr:energy-coupling factor ABC transporter ATP-binding protein [Defluviitaleaceae bacterium]
MEDNSNIFAVEVRNLSIDYGKYPVLQDLSFTVRQDEAVLLKGPSGCGKSTLLHVICGLIPNVISANISGEALLYGTKIADLTSPVRARNIGIVFQNPETQLFCDSVEDEIAFGLENICMPINEISTRIDEVLELTQMQDFRYASPKELSGGQKQRVILAAVLAMRPKILLLDEALSQMDISSKKILIEHFKTLRSRGHTMLMVDHDDILAEIATRIINL